MGKLLSNSFLAVKSVFTKNIPDIKLNPEENRTIWNIAKAGIEGYNFFTDNDIELVAAVDEKGEIIGYAVLGDNIQYLKKNQRIKCNFFLTLSVLHLNKQII